MGGLGERIVKAYVTHEALHVGRGHRLGWRQ